MKRLLSVVSIIAVIIVVTFISKVYASQYNGVIYRAEKIDGIYFYKHRDDTEDNHYVMHNFHEEAYVYRRSTDGAFVYCIESWATLDGQKKGDYNEETIYNDFTSSVKDKIKLYAYYGYGYKDGKYDHTNIKWYAITQYLIWVTQAPYFDHYFVDSLESTTPIYPFENEIEELKGLVDNHNITPNFNNIQNKIYINDVVTLEDTNQVLKDNYEIIYTSNNIKASKSNNSLVIQALSNGVGTITLRKTSKRTNNSFKYYISDDYQDCMSVGDLDSITIDVTIRIESGKVNINKYGEILDKVIRDDDGTLDIIYKITELNNVKFLLYAASDIVNNIGDIIYPKDSLIKEYITNDSGLITDNLPLGSYYLIEDYQSNKYVSNKEKIYFTLDENNLSEEINVYNNFPELKLEFKKIGENFIIKDELYSYEYINLSNVTFGLYARDNIYDENGNILIESDTLIKSIKTNEYGVGEIVLKIPYGNYYLKEIDTDCKYVLDTNKYYFSYDYEDKDIVNIKINESLINYLKKGNVNIRKTDMITGEVLSGVKFSIYDEFEYLIYEGYTDENGLLVFNLPYGKYFIKEIHTLDGYILNEDLYEFIIDDANQNINIEIVNSKVPTIEVMVPGTANNCIINIYGLIINIISVLCLFKGGKM